MAKNNARQFSVSLQRFAKKTMPEAFLALKWKAAALTLEGVVLRSPVDTGFFRANWQVNIGQRPDGVIQSYDLAGGATITRGLAVIQQAQPGDEIWISNAVVYGPALENGHSQQAPQGMVRLTLADLRSSLGVAA